tara:strand:+ start:5587 stop:5988 length:402 start_codon:yes stop_codon:yes gene_type:complete
MNKINIKLSNIYVPISIGELADKITILEIKKEIMTGIQLKNVTKELEILLSIIRENDIEIENNLFTRLKEINSSLWKIEDQIRLKECNNEFDEVFIELARSVYIKNDKRALIKKEINMRYNSDLIEEKYYKKY